jgi:hypothetical protein
MIEPCPLGIQHRRAAMFTLYLILMLNGAIISQPVAYFDRLDRCVASQQQVIASMNKVLGAVCVMERES